MNEIILNEKEWAERAIEVLSLGSRPYDTIVRVAKYYKSQGFSKNDLRRHVEDFIIRSDPRISLVAWADSITSALNAAERYPLIMINGITITDSEMKKIQLLQSTLQQRLIFTLLCLAKYGDAVNPKNSGWVNLQQRDIFSLANITMTKRRQSLLINDLWNMKLIAYSCIVDNINLRVLIEEDGEPEMFITDFRNLGYQFMRHIKPAGYAECLCCGLVIRSGSGSAGRPAKYCKDCAKAVKYARDADRNYILGLGRQFSKNSQKLYT